ncbi:MAG: hypothetical protein ACF8LL_02545 [Phycisphaerales bacterium]
MTTLQHNTNYEIDRLDESQAIVVKHIEDESNGQPLFWGLVTYIALLPALFGALMLMSFI